MISPRQIGLPSDCVTRALAQTILAIEAEAIAPHVEALQEADGVLENLAARGPSATWDAPLTVDIVRRAEVAHRMLRSLLEPRGLVELG